MEIQIYFPGKENSILYMSLGIHPKGISGFLPDPTFYLTPEVSFSAFLSTSMFFFISVAELIIKKTK